MLEPYASIRDRHSHGDVIVWPLKAVCDYVEATNDLGFLDEPVAWRREDTFEKTERRDPVAAHLEKLLATVRDRFIPGTHLIRYGEGDWNDSLQPADPHLRDWMVSSWTVSLLYQQLNRYAEVLTRAGRARRAAELAALARSVREDFNRHLMRDGTVAGYAVFDPAGGEPELMLHPRDTRTGLRYSLLPMTRSIIGGLFTEEQARHHLRADPRASALPRRRSADGSAGGISRRAPGGLPARRIRPPSSGARSGCSTSTRTFATARRWRGCARPTRSGRRFRW